jgi:hypothetical protein
MQDALIQGFAVARDAGVKVVVRFAYNFGPYPNSEPDAPLSVVLGHIQQLAPILAANEDVIAVVQAGFIGAWGEWHTSTNNLLPDKQQILEALLDVIPVTRMTQVRYPPYKSEMYGGPLDAGTAWTGTYGARTGHHNDCFLASDDDFGTYPIGEIETWKAFVEEETKYTPMGGETCNPNPPRTDCPTALEELERLHFSFLNLQDHPDVIQAWIDQGCFPEIERRLGYRLELAEAWLPDTVRPGGHFDFSMSLSNVGWAGMYNPRAALLVLEGPGGLFETVAVDDVRGWAAGEAFTVSGRLDMPAMLDEGTYHLGVWMPDASPSIRGRSEYAVRFANDGTWVQASGLNALGAFVVSDDAPGTSDDNQSFTFTPTD